MPATTHEPAVFKLAKGWAIVTYIVLPPLIALFLWLLAEPFTNGNGTYADNSKYHWWLAVGYVAGILLFIYALADCRKSKTVLTGEKLYTQSLFSYRELYLDEIKGYRHIENYILVEPLSAEKKKLQISTYYGNINSLVHWLSEYYPDLDLLEQQQEYMEILEGESLGMDATERELKLEKARKNAKILNWAGGLASVWLCLHPEPYEFAVLSCLLIPIAGILAIRFSNGLLRLDEKKNSAYPEVSLATIIPSLALGIRAVMDYDIYDYTNVWIVAGAITITGAAMIIFGNKAFKFNKLSDYLVILGVTFVMFFYGFGSTVLINCYYDSSSPEIYSTKILEKRVSSGESTTYHFEVAAPSNTFNPEEVSVTKEMYEQFQKGDPITIYLHKGLFNISWFYIVD